MYVLNTSGSKTAMAPSRCGSFGYPSPAPENPGPGMPRTSHQRAGGLTRQKRAGSLSGDRGTGPINSMERACPIPAHRQKKHRIQKPACGTSQLCELVKSAPDRGVTTHRNHLPARKIATSGRQMHWQPATNGLRFSPIFSPVRKPTMRGS